MARFEDLLVRMESLGLVKIGRDRRGRNRYAARPTKKGRDFLRILDILTDPPKNVNGNVHVQARLYGYGDCPGSYVGTLRSYRNGTKRGQDHRRAHLDRIARRRNWEIMHLVRSGKPPHAQAKLYALYERRAAELGWPVVSDRMFGLYLARLEAAGKIRRESVTNGRYSGRHLIVFPVTGVP